MYLKQAVVENSGPLEWLNLTLNFYANGSPKPLIFVGGNGTGKTNFLSLIADALFEAATVHYKNVLPETEVGRAWFRVVGARTTKFGKAGSFSLLRFDDEGVTRTYKEKAGTIDPAVASLRVPSEFVGQLTWPTEGSFKEFSIDDQISKLMFENEVYAYFPSSRSEVPHWLNRDALSDVEFDVTPIFSQRLRKPIYIERALDSFKQWLIGVLSDTRSELSPNPATPGSWRINGNPYLAIQSSEVLEICNKLLQSIFCDDQVRFVWLGRKSSDKVAIVKGGEILCPSLDALSTGQATLLGIFGTLLRYGDMSQNGSSISLDSIKGICVVDEIDAHIHVDLQHRILPGLVKLFPNIQFVLSSHSPIFVLGMEKLFGSENIQVVDMPTGIPVGAEAYSEFGSALDALAASSAFTKRVVDEARGHSKPLVYVEGETDAPYLRKAAELLGRTDILDNCDIEWIGAKDTNGQGFHTGKDALKHTLSVLKANPKLAVRKILLLNDNDGKAPDQNYERVYVRTLPLNKENSIVTAGIENLLSEDCLAEEFYQEKVSNKPNGDVVKTRTLRKAALCEAMCNHGSAAQFLAFNAAFSVIDEFLAIPT
ncbi:AAA family ATPase [Acetobacter malorum]|uniref:AAA family ATPase n=1 Tax=Acetobacter malorum TaxID=178901 RepID=UPI0039EA9A2C